MSLVLSSNFMLNSLMGNWFVLLLVFDWFFNRFVFGWLMSSNLVLDCLVLSWLVLNWLVLLFMLWGFVLKGFMLNSLCWNRFFLFMRFFFLGLLFLFGLLRMLNCLLFNFLCFRFSGFSTFFWMLLEFSGDEANSRPLLGMFFLLSAHLDEKSASEYFLIRPIFDKIDGIYAGFKDDFERSGIIFLDFDELEIGEGFFNILLNSIEVAFDQIKRDMFDVVCEIFYLIDKLLLFGNNELTFFFSSLHHHNNYNIIINP